MIKRLIATKLKQTATQFPVITLTGPRQSGKTTLLRNQFPDYEYVSLEEPDTREWAEQDPRNFLRQYNKFIIFDEVQRVPNLFSYLQTKTDEQNIPGQFILSGSQSFLLNEKISQSLAGRAAILNLLPFSLSELQNTDPGHLLLNDYIFNGFFPRIYDQQIDPVDFYNSYIKTYVERDVRLIRNITDISDFTRFLKLCAGRTGQLLNISAIATECGISTNTAKGWLALLEQSFIVFLLRPFHKNFNKRLVKMPKLYFYDTGLVCSLLEIENTKQLNMHYLRGSLFENFIILELLKARFNKGRNSNLYFWRNNHGNEIDCIVETAGQPIAIEIKSGETFTTDFLKGINYWNKLTGGGEKDSFIVYGGDIPRKVNNSILLSWKNLDQLTGKS
ncbi:MAG: ATP-binding protein [Chlorobi bacterium]|nr:ATP-binding protein [Chlorobiota bacterium]